MRPFTVCGTGVVALCLLAGLDARQVTFRGGVDLVELDVSVLDKDRHPVSGLAASDFTVTIDNQPRRVATFKEIDVPPPAPAPRLAAWTRDVAPDVASNAPSNGRVVVIMIDDGSFTQKDADTTPAYLVSRMRAIGHAAVDALGSEDLAAVVFTENNHTAQNFTKDRSRLLAAIDHAALIPSDQVLNSGNKPSCPDAICGIEALEWISDSLKSLPQRRKVIMYLSVGHPAPIFVEDASIGEGTLPAPFFSNEQNHASQAVEAMIGVIKSAQMSNATVEAIDVEGLTVNGGEQKNNFMKAMAQSTGGRAVVNDNNPERQIPSLLAESSSYYLLGVERPIVKDGRLHPIRVSVNRRGVEVRARTGYYAPTDKDLRKAAATPTHGVDASVADALAKSDFPLEVAVAPFAGTTSGKADVAVVLDVHQPKSTAAMRDPVDIVIRAFNPEMGSPEGTWRQRMNIVWNGSAAAESGMYEVLGRVPLAPGRYELRVGVESAGSQAASVYTYVDVPKFPDGPLSASGLVLTAVPSPKSAPKDVLATLMPVVPTARRTFHGSDRVTAFWRLYASGGRAADPVTITTRIVDTHDRQIGGDVRTIDPAGFTSKRTLDDRFDVPTRLPAGEYLLSVEAAAGKARASRALRFRVEEARPPAARTP